MRFRENMRYCIYRRILAGSLMLLTLVTVVLTMVVTHIFGHNTTVIIANNSQAMFSQIDHISNMLYEQAFSTSARLIIDHDVIAAMLLERRDPVIEYRAMRKLISVQSQHPYILHVDIYNAVNGSYLSSVWLSDESIYDSKNFIKNFTDFSRFAYFPSESVIYDTHSSATESVLKFFMFSGDHISGAYRSAVVINIRGSYIRDALLNINAHDGSETFIIDSTGIALFYTIQNETGQNILTHDHIRQILESDQGQGFFTGRIDGRRYIITYAKSEQLSWIYVNANPYESVTGSLYDIRNRIILITVIVFAIGLIFCFWLTEKFYNPIQALIERIINRTQDTTPQRVGQLINAFSNTLNQIDAMSRYMDNTSHFLRQSYFRTLISGPSAGLERLEDIQVGQVGNYFQVLLFRLDNICAIEESERAVCCYAMANMLEEQLSKFVQCIVFESERCDVAAILILETNTSPPNCTLAIQEIQLMMRRHFELTFSASFGTIVADKAKMSESMRAANECLDYRYLYGNESIINMELLGSHDYRKANYPSELENRVIESIKAQQEKQAYEALQKFKEAVALGMPKTAHTFLQQLLIAVIKQFAYLSSHVKDVLYSCLNLLDNAENISESIEILKSALMAVLDELQNKNATNHQQIVDTLCDYIKAHYANPELSLDILAKHVHLSSGYAGKLFKSYTNQTIVDFINDTRMEYACVLLRETDDTIAAICEKIGYNNSSYFFSIFKKKMGMTPIQYRKQDGQAEYTLS